MGPDETLPAADNRYNDSGMDDKPSRLLRGGKSRMIWIDGAFTAKKTLTGVQRYAHELCGTLRELDCAFEFAEPGAWASLPGGIQFWEQFRLPDLPRRGDTLFAPCNLAPWRLPAGIRLVVTIHCLRFLHYPEGYSPAFRRYYRHAIPRVIQRADQIITVSEYMRLQIESCYPAAAGKTTAVPLGISPLFHPAKAGEAPAEPYILFVGNNSRAKNLETLCKAMTASPELRKLPLKLLGCHRPPYAPELAIEAIPVETDSSRVAELYRRAFLVAVPSLYESFSLPVLEGFASGVPTLISDIPAHRELAGEGAVYFPPEDAEKLRHRLEEACASPDLRQRMSAYGLERAKAFTWETAARRTWELLHEGP